jgi:hypothetical protein
MSDSEHSGFSTEGCCASEDEAEAELTRTSAFRHSCYYCNARAVASLHRQQSASFVYNEAQRILINMQTRAIHTDCRGELEAIAELIKRQVQEVRQLRAKFIEAETGYLESVDSMSACLLRPQTCC